MKNNKGFTILEIMIVIAIAGLILIIVFLAVPALKVSQRNSERLHDATIIDAAIQECLGNSGDNQNYCSTPTNLDITPSELSIFSATDPAAQAKCDPGFQCVGVGVHYGTNCIDYALNPCGTNIADNLQAAYIFGQDCAGNKNSSDFEVVWWIAQLSSPGVNARCLDG